MTATPRRYGEEQIDRSYGKRGAKSIKLHVEMTMVHRLGARNQHRSQHERDREGQRRCHGAGLSLRAPLRAVERTRSTEDLHFKGVGTRIHLRAFDVSRVSSGCCCPRLPGGSAFSSRPPREAATANHSYNDAVIYRTGGSIGRGSSTRPSCAGSWLGRREWCWSWNRRSSHRHRGHDTLNTFRIGNPDMAAQPSAGARCSAGQQRRTAWLSASLTRADNVASGVTLMKKAQFDPLKRLAAQVIPAT